jgi:chromosome segregation ATPase
MEAGTEGAKGGQQQRRGKLRAALADERERTRGLRRDVEAAQLERARLQDEVTAAQREAEHLRERIERMEDAAVERLKGIDKLQRQVAATQLTLERLKSSRSWRLTRPVRGVGSALRRLSPRRARS